MTPTVDASIIIVNWNTKDLLRECVESICSETSGISYEIIVIDNASSDNSAKMIKQNYPEVRLIENRENLGFAAANNQGIDKALGRYLLLLNSDTLILDNAIAKTVDFADRHPQCGVVGCQVWEDNVRIQMTCFRFHSPWNMFCVSFGLSRLFPSSKIFGGDKMQYWDRKTEREVDVVSGMYMLVRREAVDKVGLLDDRFFIYCEEADWCFRMRQAGWKCVFWPGAQIIHLDGGGKSTSQVNVKMEVEKVKSQLLFIGKHYGILAERFVRISITMSSAAKILLQVAFWPLAPKSRGDKISKFCGIIQCCFKSL